MNIELPMTTKVDGRDWHLFGVEYETADGKFQTYLYALSFEHADLMCSELRETAKVFGQIAGTVKP